MKTNSNKPQSTRPFLLLVAALLAAAVLPAAVAAISDPSAKSLSKVEQASVMQTAPNCSPTPTPPPHNE
jgi:hypothetical protein